MKTELKIGDRLYLDSRYHGLSLVTVERLTNTTAVLNNGAKLDNPTSDFVRAKSDNSPHTSTYYRLATDDLDSQYQRQNLLKQAKSIDWDNLSTATIKELLYVLKSIIWKRR